MLEALNGNTEFGLVPFARNVGTHRDHLVAATRPSKTEATAWLSENLKSYRISTDLPYRVDGIQGALEVAFQLRPEVIYILSDGDFQRNAGTNHPAGDVPWDDLRDTLRDLRRTHGIQPRLHFIGFRVEADAAGELRRLARHHGGTFTALGDS